MIEATLEDGTATVVMTPQQAIRNLVRCLRRAREEVVDGPGSCVGRQTINYFGGMFTLFLRNRESIRSEIEREIQEEGVESRCRSRERSRERAKEGESDDRKDEGMLDLTRSRDRRR